MIVQIPSTKLKSSKQTKEFLTELFISFTAIKLAMLMW